MALAPAGPGAPAPKPMAASGAEGARVEVAPSDDGEPPEWPDESVESAMIAEGRERQEDGPAAEPRKAPKAEAEPEEGRPLPELDALVARIPAEVRETLDELFRARFTAVRRVPKTALK